MKPSPLKYSLRSMHFVGLVSTFVVIGFTLYAAGCTGVAWGILRDKREAA